MKQYFIVSLAIAAMALAPACKNRPKGETAGNTGTATGAAVSTATDRTVSVKFKKVRKTMQARFSDWMEEPEIIALDSSDPDAYSAGGTLILSDNYLCLSGSSRQPARLYERKTGRYIAKLGAVGRGPGEYFAIYSGQIDEQAGRIYLLPWMSREVLVFNLQGKLEQSIPLAYESPKGLLKVDAGRRTLTLAVVPFKGTVPSVAWEQDFEGNIQWEIPAGHLTVVPDFSNEIYGDLSGNGTFGLVTWGGRPDSLYRIGRNGMEAVMTMDFDTREIEQQQYHTTTSEDTPIHDYKEIPGYWITSVSFPATDEQGNSVTGKPRLIATDRSSGESRFLEIRNDYLAREDPENWLNCQQGYLWNYMDAGSFREAADEALKGELPRSLRERYEALLKTVQENDNFVVFLYPYKKR